MLKKRVALIPSVVLVASIFCISSAVVAGYVLNVNTALATNDPLYKGLEAFRDNVKAKSNGEIVVKLFPSSQLGKDEDVLEQARAGAPVAVVVDGGRLAIYEKELGALGAPFLVSGDRGIRKVVTSDRFEGMVSFKKKADALSDIRHLA